MVDDCIFCKLSEDKSKVIYENDNFYSVLDINQDVPGHGVVISKEHFENTLALPNSLGSAFLDCVKQTSLELMKKYNAEGFNIVGNNTFVAGQVIMHFHVHILPRRKDDEIKIPV